jgi:ABC-type amino acid transport substrate-binding protein
MKDSKDFKIVGELFSVEPFGVGIRQGDSELRDEVNFTIQDLWTSGEYTKLYHSWFGSDPTIPIEVWP